MAHRQAGEENSRAISSSPEKSTDTSGKDRLNRRNFLKAGTVAAATLVGTGSSLTTASSSATTGETFMTDFEEYAL
ncbi:twin-arginine translocation signal domain-containing protein [Natronomonas sp.]|uniref:twin-arginine translocation signal domain-containing protein n=1 Tax=Natronomonas sp. TaxID=2184060 RepID=UPI003FA5D7D4